MTRTDKNRTSRALPEGMLRTLEQRVIASARRSIKLIVQNKGCCDLHEDEMLLVRAVEALDEAAGMRQNHQSQRPA